MNENTPPDSPRTGIKWWLWLNLLSLDAPIVAILWQSALAHCYQVALLPGAQLSLFLAVWLIYMVDRVLDSYSAVSVERMSARHAFYRRHRKLFSWVVIPTAAITLAYLSLMTIPSAVMFRGVTLAFLVALYLLHFAARKHRNVYIAGNIIVCGLGIAALWALPFSQEFRLGISCGMLGLFGIGLTPRWHGFFRVMPKELFCGYLFAMGCSLNVGFYSMDAFARPLSPEVLLMAILFSLNCVAIACYERKTDAVTDPTSISHIWPGIVRMYPALLATFGIFAAILLRRAMHPEMLYLTVAVALSTLFLGALHVFARRFTPELSRVLADVAVALPIVLLIARA